MTEGQQNKMNLHQGNMRAPRHQCREEEPVAEVKHFREPDYLSGMIPNSIKIQVGLCIRNIALSSTHQSSCSE